MVMATCAGIAPPVVGRIYCRLISRARPSRFFTDPAPIVSVSSVGTAYVTDDVGLVLRIAKHFGETGGPLPEARWEPH
jgi:hypothetical protein